MSASGREGAGEREGGREGAGEGEGGRKGEGARDSASSHKEVPRTCKQFYSVSSSVLQALL